MDKQSKPRNSSQEWRIFSNPKLEAALAIAEITLPVIAIAGLLRVLSLDPDISNTEGLENMVTMILLANGSLYLLGDGIGRIDILRRKTKSRK